MPYPSGDATKVPGRSQPGVATFAPSAVRRLKTESESATGRSRKVQLEIRGLLMKLCKARLIASLLPVILMMCAREATAQRYIVDDFESASRRIVQPQSTVDNQKYLWGLY